MEREGTTHKVEFFFICIDVTCKTFHFLLRLPPTSPILSAKVKSLFSDVKHPSLPPSTVVFFFSFAFNFFSYKGNNQTNCSVLLGF